MAAIDMKQIFAISPHLDHLGVQTLKYGYIIYWCCNKKFATTLIGFQ